LITLEAGGIGAQILYMAAAVDNSERLNFDFGNDTCPRQVCGGQNPHSRAIHPRTAEASMQYRHQIILQLEQDPAGTSTIRDMSRGLFNKHPIQSTHYLFDVKGDNPTLVYKNGVIEPQFYQNMRSLRRSSVRQAPAPGRIRLSFSGIGVPTGGAYADPARRLNPVCNGTDWRKA
jgi:hypothetical protein